MDTLIQDVLAYTRVLHSDIKMEAVNLDELVRQIIGTYPPLHDGRAEIQIQGMLPRVFGNKASLSQCVSNLLINAIKFVAPGTKPLVKVWARAERADPRVRLWVEDNGIGIAPKDQERIFKMFERVSPNYEGTGIGLAIVQKAMERMGGKAGVESAIGIGSKFWIQLSK
jgi:signal transduction histidine kinase